MAESLHLPDADRATQWAALLPQLELLVSGEPDATANLANLAAALRQAFGFFWVGFYLAQTDGTLVLGPFQGPIACSRIPPGRGVCGAAFVRRETMVVPDVEKFPGHIACSSASKSEVVVPLMAEDGRALGVLDVDSDRLADFPPADVAGLERVAQLAARCVEAGR